MSDESWSNLAKFAHWYARSKTAHMVFWTFGFAVPYTAAFWARLLARDAFTLRNATIVVLIAVGLGYLAAIVTWTLYFKRRHLEIMKRDPQRHY